MFCRACGQQNDDSAALCISCGRPLLNTPQTTATVSDPVPADTQMTSGEPVYGSFWRRFVALIIDSLIIGMVNAVIAFVVLFLSAAGNVGMEEKGVAMIAGQFVAWGLSFFVGLFYFSLMESSRRQATIGKMAVNLKVVDLEGNRLSFWRALGRYASHFVTNLTCGVGYLMNVFTARQQCLHDLIAGTLVVSKAVTPEVLAQHPVERASSGQKISAIVAWCFLLLMMVLFVGLAIFGVVMAGREEVQKGLGGWSGPSSKMREAETLGAQASAAVAEYYKQHGSLPDSLAAAGFSYASSALEDIWLDDESGEIHLELGFSPLRGKSLILIPEADEDDNLIWYCVSDDVPKRSLPEGCVSTQ